MAGRGELPNVDVVDIDEHAIFRINSKHEVLGLNDPTLKAIGERAASGGLVVVSRGAHTAGRLLLAETDQLFELEGTEEIKEQEAQMGSKYLSKVWDEAIKGPTEASDISRWSLIKPEDQVVTEGVRRALDSGTTPVLVQKDPLMPNDYDYRDTLSATLATRLQNSGLFGSVRLLMVSTDWTWKYVKNIDAVLKDPAKFKNWVPGLETTPPENRLYVDGPDIVLPEAYKEGKANSALMLSLQKPPLEYALYTDIEDFVSVTESEAEVSSEPEEAPESEKVLTSA